MSDKLIANTKGQALDQHLFAIGFLAAEMMRRMTGEEKLAKAAFLAGCWHDMGKVDPVFQKWLARKIKNKDTKELADDHPRHNEISFVLFYLMNKQELSNDALMEDVKHTVFWHHDKWPRKEGDLTPLGIWENWKKNTEKNGFVEACATVPKLIENISVLSQAYSTNDPFYLLTSLDNEVDEGRHRRLRQLPRPAYKEYYNSKILRTFKEQVTDNARKNLIRMAVISADHKISGLSADALSQHIEQGSLSILLEEIFRTESTLQASVHSCLEGFEKTFPSSERNRQQAEAAQNLAHEDAHIGVLEGAAGCGKTKIALEWAAQTDVQKMIWICPRVQICQGLMATLTASDYLPDAKIEILTVDFKYISQSGKETKTPEGESFSGDIVITTIDQVANAIVTHKGVTSLVDFMNAHVVFDEFHEFMSLPALNLLFAELVRCKQYQEREARTLLVSATPNHFYINDFLNIRPLDIIFAPTFNTNKFKIEFSSYDERVEDENHPLYQSQPEHTFVISNTATTAQKSFIDKYKEENSLLFHSKFTKKDKQELFEKVLGCFKQDGKGDYDTLRSGPIVQASLDISCAKMVTEFTHAENWLQRMGRLDRFGQNTGQNLYVTAIPEIIARGGIGGTCASFLRQLYSRDSAIAWYKFTKDKLAGKLVSLEEVYQIYRCFYEEEANREAVARDFVACLQDGVKMLTNKMVEPVYYKSSEKQDKAILRNYSLRGNSRYVQMAQCSIESRSKIDYLEEYACELDSQKDNQKTFTSSVEGLMRASDDNHKSLLAYMVEKDHQIFPKKYKDKYGYSPQALLGRARQAEKPIYTSYTPHDLGHRNNHEEAVYYALCDRQAIGAITINKLVKKRKSK